MLSDFLTGGDGKLLSFKHNEHDRNSSVYIFREQLYGFVKESESVSEERISHSERENEESSLFKGFSVT